jgi:hypothetical protein
MSADEILNKCPWCGEDMRPVPAMGEDQPDLVCENGHEWWDGEEYE